jgi:hypothetical protein
MKRCPRCNVGLQNKYMDMCPQCWQREQRQRLERKR